MVNKNFNKLEYINEFTSAITEGDLEKLKHLFSIRPTINTSPKYIPLFKLACTKNNLDIVRYLYENRCSKYTSYIFTIYNYHINECLISSIANNNVEITKYLINMGGNIKIGELENYILNGKLNDELILLILKNHFKYINYLIDLSIKNNNLKLLDFIFTNVGDYKFNININSALAISIKSFSYEIFTYLYKKFPVAYITSHNIIKYIIISCDFKEDKIIKFMEIILNINPYIHHQLLTDDDKYLDKILEYKELSENVITFLQNSIILVKCAYNRN